jgi:tRNA (adenine22-N1)-methyltransferase
MVVPAVFAVIMKKSDLKTGEIMNLPRISKRLEAAASLVRTGSRIADIGTDHAYLPIYLYATGAVSGGVVSDINQGPVDRARANLSDYACENAFVAQKADGLCGVLQYGVDDIFILGMGGELIANIIDKEPNIKNEKYRLILQPMTHPEILREYLFKNGFEIIAEKLVDEDKIYQIILAVYTGKQTGADSFELAFGKLNLARRGDELTALLKRTKTVLGERVKGKAVSGADDGYERYMLEKIDGFLEKEKDNDRS